MRTSPSRIFSNDETVWGFLFPPPPPSPAPLAYDEPGRYLVFVHRRAGTSGRPELLVATMPGRAQKGRDDSSPSSLPFATSRDDLAERDEPGRPGHLEKYFEKSRDSTPTSRDDRTSTTRDDRTSTTRDNRSSIRTGTELYAPGRLVGRAGPNPAGPGQRPSVEPGL